MFVIGCAGQMQAGKDSIADYLKEQLNQTGGNWTRTAFASNVKKVYCETFGVDLEFVEKWKVLSEAPPGFDMNVRSSLQFIGDGFRKIMSTIWLDLAFRDKTTPKIISDVRYVNEFMRVKAEGGLNILVGRPDKLNDDPNGSEAQIRPYVKWCLDNFSPVNKFLELAEARKAGGYDHNLMPSDMDKFDVFIRNDGTKEDLHATIDTHLVPYVQNYVFDLSYVKPKENQCLISS